MPRIKSENHDRSSPFYTFSAQPKKHLEVYLRALEMKSGSDFDFDSNFVLICFFSFFFFLDFRGPLRFGGLTFYLYHIPNCRSFSPNTIAPAAYLHGPLGQGSTEKQLIYGFSANPVITKELLLWFIYLALFLGDHNLVIRF